MSNMVRTHKKDEIALTDHISKYILPFLIPVVKLKYRTRWYN